MKKIEEKTSSETTALAASPKQWQLTLSTGHKLKIPSYLTPEMLQQQQQASGMSVEEFESLLMESYEETADVRKSYPIVRLKSDPDGDHQFVALLGLLDAREGDAVKPIKLGKELYAIVVHSMTVCTLYGDDSGKRTGDGNVDKLQCMAIAQMLLPNRGAARPVEPTVVFPKLWAGERKNCKGCEKNNFNDDDCQESLSVLSIIFSPETALPELKEIHESGQYFPALVKISPTGIGNFTRRSQSREKAGYITLVGSRGQALLVTVAKLTIDDQRRGNQRWGIIRWTPLDDPQILSAIGYPVLQGLAYHYRREVRESQKFINMSMKKYAEGEYAQDDEDAKQVSDDAPEENGEQKYDDEIPFP